MTSTGLNQLTATVLSRRGTKPRRAPVRRFARFVIDTRLVDGDLTVTDAPYSPTPTVSAPYPQSLLLRGRVRAGAGPLRCRPLFPGRVLFLADQGGVVPTPGQVTREAYPNWTTTGLLLVDSGDLADPRLKRQINALTGTDDEARPSRMWYGTVRIPAAFLFDALPLLAPDEAPPGPGCALSAEHRARIVAFLRGEWGPRLRVNRRSPTASGDDAAAGWMPEFVVGADNRFLISVSAAALVAPYDGKDSAFDLAAPAGAGRLHPAHPANAAIPARRVYQLAGQTGHLVDPLPAPVTSGPRYGLLKFTRIWLAQPDCSILFPFQQVRLRDRDGNVLGQRLAANGLLFHPLPPGARTRFSVSLAPGVANAVVRVRWLSGAAEEDAEGRKIECWQRPGTDDPLDVDLAGDRVHIVIRRLMNHIMTDGPYPVTHALRGEGRNWRCTFVSMRRVIRALVDNRIAGGRLNDVRSNEITDEDERLRFDARILQIVDLAMQPYRNPFGTHLRDAAGFLPKPKGGWSPGALLIGGRPDPQLPGSYARWFLPFLNAFFPTLMPATNVRGSSCHRTRLSLGHTAYLVWQSRDFAKNDVTRNFPDRVLGRGGPGALVLTGLAGDFHLDASPPPGDEAPDDYINASIARLTDGGLLPGALLQFWENSKDFHRVINRRVARTANGHSPVFAGVIDEENVGIIDQGGRKHAVVLPTPSLSGYRILIAADWIE
ncbi:hypothetical protein OG884_33910 [Streptosporangium sp. NBC_01755]|uniref:hypothetical protein n=1 Tax=Streptosporangium sp. NBC_01755 TaxID=2975949 RepID=UPI002DDBD2B6|nr:hypothetical protein [Streptosporangium sp. NBC_01755]WSC99743.1 hypothetical protein OG884_33910 [Streptosporangium sp. NBC_01755]